MLRELTQYGGVRAHDPAWVPSEKCRAVVSSQLLFLAGKALGRCPSAFGAVELGLGHVACKCVQCQMEAVGTKGSAAWGAKPQQVQATPSAGFRWDSLSEDDELEGSLCLMYPRPSDCGRGSPRRHAWRLCNRVIRI
ncbi:unnamed protein product [Ostreobium quekettii]|uniref:Uncharacterized protein n=1 Tax=Ostreobium quekettii TaxID=121088 RepID=A0A8S1J009_9CHLO|nr:unnamed protein product [Ostreobium quekettii]